MTTQILFVIIAGILFVFFLGVKIVRPTHRGLYDFTNDECKYLKDEN